MLHVLVQFARTEYEYKPRKAIPAPEKGADQWGVGGQLHPGHAYHSGSKYPYLEVSRQKKKKKKDFCFSFLWTLWTTVLFCSTEHTRAPGVSEDLDVETVV